MRLRSSAALSLLAISLAWKALGADRVELRSGEVLDGKVLRVGDGEVSIELSSGGFVSFRISAVRLVRKNVGETGSVVIYSESDAEREKEAAGAETDESRRTEAESGRAERAKNVRADLLLGAPVRVPRHGFSIAPPKGFVAWREGESPSLPLAFREPATQATFTAATRASSESVEEAKRAAVRSYAERFSTFHVLRDEALNPPGGQDCTAWVVEIESRASSPPIRQLQVFLKRGATIITLTYSGTLEPYLRFSEAFLLSVASFRFNEDSKLGSASP